MWKENAEENSEVDLRHLFGFDVEVSHMHIHIDTLQI